MAALLKKRAVAEFSQVVQEEPKPIKKLKLVQKPPTKEVQVNLLGVSSSQQALQQLLKFEESLVEGDQIPQSVIQELIEHFQQEKEALVRRKIAQLLGNLGMVPHFSAENLVEDVRILLKSEKSHKVKAELIHSLCVLGKAVPERTDLQSSIIALAKQHLKDPDHRVRCVCLELIGAIGSPEQEVVDDSHEPFIPIQSLLAGFCGDQDSRVRASSFNAMLQFHQRGLSLRLSIYQQACQSLTDDYQDVRLSAMKLIWVLSHLYPDSLVPVSDSEDELRLVDDGFAKICNMVNDISVQVRMEAAVLLGSLHQVSPKFLEQTLDKKLMSNMRRKKSAHERAREHFASGEWATGQKWADDAPKEELDPDNVNLMNIGACGAFVHGTEDEFLEVRNAALDSLCELASQSASFANLSQDSIIDMFNDEIESVRLNAINSLRKLNRFITLREDQLEIILGVLQDFSTKTRDSLRDMLGEMKLATRECLSKCIYSLLDNLRRYPQDKLSIWKCMKNLGSHHPHLALPLVPELLCLHPYFDTPEPDMDDAAYISVLMMVFNSAVECPTVVTMFQDHTWRHYHYLQDSLPDLVPKLEKSIRVAEEAKPEAVAHSDVRSFLRNLISGLDSLPNMELSTAQPLLETMVRDLQQVTELNQKCSPSAEFVCVYLKTQLLLTKLMNQQGVQCSSSIADNQVLSLIDQILGLTRKLEHQYLGVSSVDHALIQQTRLKAGTLQILTKMKSDPTRCSQAKETYLQQLQALKKFLETNELAADPCFVYLFSVLNDLENGKISDILKHLQHAVKSIAPCGISLQNSCIRRVTAIMHEPTGSSDNPIRFTTGLTVTVPVHAMFENVQNVDCIRLKVHYPDQKSYLITPKKCHFTKLNPLHYKLISEVIISHSLWSDQSHVEISIVMETRDGETVSCQELCRPVKVPVAPKAAKR